MRPIVYLIGTGPGDPGLISTRGARYLAAADVVLYDHIVNPRLLRYPKQDAEKIDVGLAAPQPLDQEAINYLLVEKAREGKIVARLKWGDPFLFDRGGQEALFLHEHGIPFEVVPGIPAAIGGTSYAGVPLTYPGGGDSVTFVRGHEDESSTAPNIDWSSLARLGGTVVCYTGPRQLHEILKALLANGFDPGGAGGDYLRRHVSDTAHDRRHAAATGRDEKPAHQAGDSRGGTRRCVAPASALVR